MIPSVAEKMVTYPDHSETIRYKCMLYLTASIVLLGRANHALLIFYDNRELWQGQRWLKDPLYHATSATILGEEVYPGEFIAFRHDNFEHVRAKVKMFFTKVYLLLLPPTCIAHAVIHVVYFHFNRTTAFLHKFCYF